MTIERERDAYLDDIDDEDEDTMENVYLIFAVDEREYGLEVVNVIEIKGLQSITEVPDMPAHVKGIINLRGKVIPVIDVRLRFKIVEQEYHDRTCVVIVNMKEMLVGLIVDAVREVVRIPEQQMEGAPRIGQSAGSRYIKAVGKVGESVKLILDLECFLSDKEMEELGSTEMKKPELATAS